MNWMDLKIRRELRRLKRQMKPRPYVVSTGGGGAGGGVSDTWWEGRKLPPDSIVQLRVECMGRGGVGPYRPPSGSQS